MNSNLKKGYEYQDAGKYEEAIQAFKQLAVKDGNYENLVLLEIGKSLKMGNRPDEAIDYFKKALVNEPENPEVLEELYETCRLSGNLDLLQNFLQSFEEKGSGICRALAAVCREKKDFKKAYKYLKKADPENRDPGCMIELGRLKSLQGKLEEAADIFKNITKDNPQNSTALSALAGVWLKKGEIRKALDLYLRASEIESENKELYLKIVELASQLNETDISEKAASKALSLTDDKIFDKDAMLNELEILQNKTKLKSKVKRLWVTVTSRCNIRCKTCGLWQKKWDLPYKTAQEVIKLYPVLERVVWLGGEVFLYKHFEEMFDRAARYSNLRQQIITNGVILTERWINKLLETDNTELTFSVDGSSKEVYESIRIGADFDKLCRKIQKTMDIKETLSSGCDIRFNMLVVKSNYHQMESVMDLAFSMGVNQITYLAVHFENAPDENIFEGKSDRHIMNDIGKMIPKLRKKADKYGMEIDILLPPGEIILEEAVSSTEPEEIFPDPINRIYCKMPWKYMMICDDGNVIPTGSCIKSIGNINRSPLNSIWNSPAARAYRKSMIKNSYEGLCRSECFFRMGLG